MRQDAVDTIAILLVIVALCCGACLTWTWPMLAHELEMIFPPGP
jgi:hypothetical protein